MRVSLARSESARSYLGGISVVSRWYLGSISQVEGELGEVGEREHLREVLELQPLVRVRVRVRVRVGLGLANMREVLELEPLLRPGHEVRRWAGG